ncbi:MAG: HAMP domain-containing sensor histidine kinase [Flavisolibacter sp.]
MSTQLLQKNTRFLLVWLPIVLLASSILFFIVLQMHAHHMQEKQLQLKQTNVWTAFTLQPDSFPRNIRGEYDLTNQDPLPNPGIEPRDTTIYYPDKNLLLPFKVLTSIYQWNAKRYQLTTYVSSKEINHLIIKVFVTEAIILILLLLTIIIVNRRSSRSLWTGFFATIKKLTNYDLTHNQELNLPTNTGISEFDTLNKVSNDLIINITRAYHQQKQFVENASHEMQTPLAIIRSKLELLINKPNLTEKEAALLSDITEANERLSQMNRTLLLLAKIENNQFPELEEINIAQLLQTILNNYKDHYEHNIPEVTESLKSDLLIKANRPLMDILISNLLKNAIEHNVPGGYIHIRLNDQELTVENSGPPLEVETAALFDRFKKGSHQSKSTGLGLALVKQICVLYHYSISYNYNNKRHIVSVIFREN